MAVEYRIVGDMPTLERIVDLEIAVWGLHARDAVPANILHALAENGGVVIAAEAQEQIVGMCVGFPARRGRDLFLWSHMAGVHPAYQKQGIGYQLKQLQRQWALENGYSQIRWTFDPLQRGNASFNIRKLGAISNIYHKDYYGEMLDSINAGLPSDRLEVIWNLRQKTHTPNSGEIVSDDPLPCFMILSDEGDLLRRHDVLSGQPPAVFVEIPADLAVLKRQSPQLALEWRLAVREAMQQAFQRGYHVADFTTIRDRWAYVLLAPIPWFLYVAECSDHSLYTGITTDIDRRIRQHNAGNGAAYTAARRPVKLLAGWRFPDQSSALRAEAAFKSQSRSKKMRHVHSRDSFLGGERLNL